LYHGITVEHSYNCMVLLCRLFLGLSRRYTKSVPYALNGQYIYNYIAAHYTYQNNVVGVIPICVKEGSTITVNNVQACLTGSSAYYDVTKNVISFERQNDYCIGIALELSNAYANTALRVTFTVSP
jgi:hypothetical protein